MLGVTKGGKTVSKFCIVYDANGGVAEKMMEPTVIEYGVGTKLRKNTYTKKGYVFIGWKASRISDKRICYVNEIDRVERRYCKENEQPAGWKEYLYTDESKVAYLSKIDNDIIVMSAQWQKVTVASCELPSNFIVISFPASNKSIVKNAVLREIYDNEVPNAVIDNFKIWEMSLEEQVAYISSLMKENYKNFVIFAPGVYIPQYIPTELVRALRKMENAPEGVVLILMDGISRLIKFKGMTLEDYKTYFEPFDLVYSYDSYEAMQHGFVYRNLPIKKFNMENKKKDRPKVFCIGRAKGRLETMKKVAQKLDDNGVDYEFLVLRESGTEEEQDIGGIHFIDYMEYDSVVKHIDSATCMLSLVAEYNNAMPLSYTEAIMYNKKLLTNSKYLKEQDGYNECYMRSFNDVDDIDISWLCNGENVDYNYQGEYSAETFLKQIEEDYDSGFLKRCAILNTKLQQISNL